jgi:hypothetical protein
MGSRFFDLSAHRHACHAANGVAVMHALDGDTYVMERQGEVSLMDRETLIMTLKQLARGGSSEQVGGGDVG